MEKKEQGCWRSSTQEGWITKNINKAVVWSNGESRASDPTSRFYSLSQLKMDQKFKEVLRAIANSHPEEQNGKKLVGEEHSRDPHFLLVETTKGINPIGMGSSWGSRNGRGGGSGGRGDGHTTGGECWAGANRRFHKCEMLLVDGTNIEE